MKFESRFGIGEICGYNEGAHRGDKRMDDILVKVIAVAFESDGIIVMHVEHIGSAFGVQRFVCSESALFGDPAFDQTHGAYPPDHS